MEKVYCYRDCYIRENDNEKFNEGEYYDIEYINDNEKYGYIYHTDKFGYNIDNKLFSDHFYTLKDIRNKKIEMIINYKPKKKCKIIKLFSYIKKLYYKIF